jgi:hypothetical protein
MWTKSGGGLASFQYCVDAMMQNAWLLFRKTPSYQDNRLNLLAFRRDVAHVYIVNTYNQQGWGIQEGHSL